MTEVSDIATRTKDPKRSRRVRAVPRTHLSPVDLIGARAPIRSARSPRRRVGDPGALRPTRTLTAVTPAPDASDASGENARVEVHHVEIMGVRVDDVDHELVVNHVMDAIGAGRSGWVVTPNVDILRQLVADPDLAELAGRADLSLADGMPLVWASRLRGTPLRSRVAGSELLHPLCEAAASRGRRVYLLGGAPGVAARAAEMLTTEVPNLTISGTEAPPDGFEDDPAEVATIIEHLEQGRPDLVFCAFGFPKQERLMANLVEAFPATWFVGCGGTLDMACGDRVPAPGWMRHSGLEWLHRLRLEPQRLVRRYLIDDMPFALRMMATSYRDRYRRWRRSPQPG